MRLYIDRLKRSKDLAILLGMFVGDGCLPVKHNGEGHRVYSINFFNTKKDYVDIFGKLFSKIFNVNGKIRCKYRKNKKPLWEFEKYSVDIYKKITNEFEISCGKKAKLVGIPSFIMNGTEIIKKNFFLGLLITDGCIRNDGCMLFHCASYKLSYDLKSLINDVWGFDKRIKEYLQKEKFKSYQLVLNKKESTRILSQLPPWHNLVLRGLSRR